MKTANEISTTTVTDEQIGRAHKVFGPDNKAFYKVQSSRDETVEYTVKYSREHGFTCTCKSGQYGFANCSLGVCTHVLIALAAAREEKEAVAELHRLIAEQAAPVLVINGKPASAAEVERVMNAPAKPASRRVKAPEARGFSLLR